MRGAVRLLRRRSAQARAAPGAVGRHEEWNGVGQKELGPVRLVPGEDDVTLVDGVEKCADDGRYAQ